MSSIAVTAGSATARLKRELSARCPKLYTRLGIARWYLRKTRFGLEACRNLVLDFRYGGYCGGRIGSRFQSLGAHGTSSADYYQLARLFDPWGGVAIGDSDVLVDVGCGKGRVINFWLSRGYRNRMIGLELDPEIAAFAADRLKRYSNIAILAGNALDNLPPETTIFYLFNPFGAELMEEFSQRVLDHFSGRSDLVIVYYHAKFVDVFRNDPRWVVTELPVKTFYRHAIIRPAVAHSRLELRPQSH